LNRKRHDIQLHFVALFPRYDRSMELAACVGGETERVPDVCKPTRADARLRTCCGNVRGESLATIERSRYKQAVASIARIATAVVPRDGECTACVCGHRRIHVSCGPGVVIYSHAIRPLPTAALRAPDLYRMAFVMSH